MTKRYGAPYNGSKNNIAEKVIDFLPPGKRLVDLFGGGGAITHCALTYGRNKFKTALYNDFDPMVVEYVKNAFSGKLDIDKYEPDIISKENFNELKNKRGDIAFLWSFGNNGVDYLWGEKIAKTKMLAFAMLTRKTCKERYVYYKKFVESLESIERIEPIERIQTIDSYDRTASINISERVEFSNIDYSMYEYSDGDVVYCDIPYETAKGKVRYAEFDYKRFYDWAYTRPYPVYISSYKISDERLTGHALVKRKQLLSKTADDTRLEMIYMNDAAVEEKKQEMLIF